MRAFREETASHAGRQFSLEKTGYVRQSFTCEIINQDEFHQSHILLDSGRWPGRVRTSSSAGFRQRAFVGNRRISPMFWLRPRTRSGQWPIFPQAGTHTNSRKCDRRLTIAAGRPIASAGSSDKIVHARESLHVIGRIRRYC